jgi:N-methylhydantoinase B/oxoprolinase/acetone carboxylase alpha subunit
MNNFTFGDGATSITRPSAGGSGAGPGFRRRDAVQTHMTNSRLTDPEVLEWRFPVMIDRFAIRRGSGGKPAGIAAATGSSGISASAKPMTAAILSGRRKVPPFGVDGGQPGAGRAQCRHPRRWPRRGTRGDGRD